MIVMIEAFLRKLWRIFNIEEWTVWLLNLSKIKNVSTEAGLVMIQIDGLGMTQAQRAIQRGNMPFLARLLKNEGYTIFRHYSGLPSNTPAVQGQLFYGVKTCVPAFSFKDSRSGKVFNMFHPDCASAVEQRIKEKGRPLLEGGSCYGNIFTGGAKEAHFCVSSMGWGGLLKMADPFGVTLTILLNFHIFVRALFLILVECVIAAVESVRGILSGKKLMREIKFIPLRVAVCVFLREVVAAGAKIDIARGLGVIHINLAGFDEQAHHRGPSSTFAHWSLRGIDNAIGKIWKASLRSSKREYNVFIYSDHGQEETLSYQDEYGRSVEDAVGQVLEEHNSSRRWHTEFNGEIPYWRANLFRNKPEKILKTPFTKMKDSPLIATVTSMGPVGHIYLPEVLSNGEKEKIALQLIAMAKIPIVMISQGSGQALAWTSQGKYIFPEEAANVIEADHPFFNDVVHDLVKLCDHPDSGDLIIFGWRKGFKSLTFHAERGSHAGPGAEETSGFALLPMGALPGGRQALPRSFNETIYTTDLRNAAFRAQGIRHKGTTAMMDRAMPISSPGLLRIMTYNVHGCIGRDGKISPHRIAGIIARHDPDIVGLQELVSNERVHQAEIIAQILGMSFQFDATLSTKKGKRGNAILSRYPMRPMRNGRLPKLFQTPILEPRGALWVEIDRQGLKIQVFNTHLSLSSMEGLLQMRALCGVDWIGNPACQSPIIFCGDLNALSNSRICKHLGQLLKNTHLELNGHHSLKTLPSFYPLGLVDHIFIGTGFKTIKNKTPRTALERISSDHLPLITDVEITSISPDRKYRRYPDIESNQLHL